MLHHQAMASPDKHCMRLQTPDNSHPMCRKTANIQWQRNTRKVPWCSFQPQEKYLLVVEGVHAKGRQKRAPVSWL